MDRTLHCTGCFIIDKVVIAAAIFIIIIITIIIIIIINDNINNIIINNINKSIIISNNITTKIIIINNNNILIIIGISLIIIGISLNTTNIICINIFISTKSVLRIWLNVSPTRRTQSRLRTTSWKSAEYFCFCIQFRLLSLWKMTKNILGKYVHLERWRMFGFNEYLQCCLWL